MRIKQSCFFLKKGNNSCIPKDRRILAGYSHTCISRARSPLTRFRTLGRHCTQQESSAVEASKLYSGHASEFWEFNLPSAATRCFVLSQAVADTIRVYTRAFLSEAKCFWLPRFYTIAKFHTLQVCIVCTNFPREFHRCGDLKKSRRSVAAQCI